MPKKKVQIKEFVEILKEAVVKLLKKVKALEEEVKDIKEKLEELEERISELEKRVSDLEKGKAKVKAPAPLEIPTEAAPTPPKAPSILLDIESITLPPVEKEAPKPPEVSEAPSTEGFTSEKILGISPSAPAQSAKAAEAMLPSAGMTEVSGEEIRKERDELLKALEDLELI